jgi:phosphoketolase
MVRIYLPHDANCFLQTMDHCLWSKNYIKLVIASKQPMPQWLTKQKPWSTAGRAHRSSAGPVPMAARTLT